MDLLGCIAALARCGPLLQMGVAWSVNWSVGLSVCLCLSVTIVSPAKTAEPVEMPFGLWTWVGPKNHVLDGAPYVPCKWAILRVKSGSCAKTAELIEMPFGFELGWAQGSMY